MRRHLQGLVPLDLAMETREKAREKRVQSRLERAWPLVVGPALVEHTRVLRVRGKVLVMGCWHPELVPSLRKSVEAIWPDLRKRLQTFLGLDFHRIEIFPCDPPPAPPVIEKKAKIEDPLLEVLKKYRALRNQGWTPKRS